jgi:ABC-type arginine/histidine transport system permease subunit
MRFVDIIVYFFRGTPLLVQIFIIYFGSGEWLWLRESMMWPYFKEPFFCALLALSLNTAAYTFVIIKGAFYSIPYYEYEACRVLSMGKFQMMRYIIVPHVLRIIVPAYGNEVITMLQNTSLASTITLMDLTGVISQINSQTYATLEFLAIGGAIYLSLSSVITYFVKFVERRFKIVGVINLNKR